MSSIDFKFGTDPEFFLFDTTKQTYISAHDIVPGTKDKPYPLKKGAVQSDGVAVEFNTEPASTAEEFATNMETVLNQVREMIPKKYTFSFRPHITFSSAYMNALPLKAKELGCNPDYSAIHVKQNPNPAPYIGNVRTSSCHLHLGWTSDADVSESSEHFVDCVHITRSLNEFWDGKRRYWDSDNTRHHYYGGNAAFRPKPYGVEYRGLSSVVLKYPNLYPYLFDESRRIFFNLVNGTNEKTGPLPKLWSKERGL